MDDNHMVGPGAHETSAENMTGENNEAATIQALLAIASAINRLAAAVETHTAS